MRVLGVWTGFTIRTNVRIMRNPCSTPPTVHIPMGVGFVNEKAILKCMKTGYYIFNALIASNFDFYVQRINDTLEILNGQIWAREEARGAYLLRRHSRRYRTECSRCPCEFVRIRWRHLRGTVKGFVVRWGRGQYRAYEDTVGDTDRKQDIRYRKRYIPLKKTRHWGYRVRIKGLRQGCRDNLSLTLQFRWKVLKGSWKVRYRIAH